MTQSPLIMAILNKAKEPLLHLRGAGYFTEEEWVQLDLIMNKKHVWTQEQKLRYQKPRSVAHSDMDIPHTVSIEVRSPTPCLNGDSIPPSPELISICTSIEPISDIIKTQDLLGDITWDLTPAIACPAPTLSDIEDQPESFDTSTASDLVSEYAINLFEDVYTHSADFSDYPLGESHEEQSPESLLARDTINLDSPSSRQKTVSSCVSQINSSPEPRINNSQKSFASKFLPVLDKTSVQGIKYTKSEKLIDRIYGDVNTFETSNAAEWDEEPARYSKEKNFRGLATISNENLVKTGERIYSGPSGKKGGFTTTSFSRRRLDMQRAGSEKESVYTQPLPKTKTCWFWAESVNGCRYRPEECLHIHVTPKPGSLPNYPLKDGKPTWGSLANAVPVEVPEGKKPQSCWFWARWGTCESGDTCDYVHGWVLGGVAPEPINLKDGSKTSEMEENVDDCPYKKSLVDTYTSDLGDKASLKERKVDPDSIANRIHALDW